jgi:hypothetical protein
VGSTYRAGVHCGDLVSLLLGLGNLGSAREKSGNVEESGSGQGVSRRRPCTKDRRDVRAAVLGCGLERQESPLRLAESGPVVLSRKSMKASPPSGAGGKPTFGTKNFNESEMRPAASAYCRTEAMNKSNARHVYHA